MPRPVHFEIHAQDMDRAQRFYEQVLGWRFEGRAPDYRLIHTGDGPGIDGGLLPRRGPAPADDTPVTAWMCTVDVPDVEAFVQKAAEAGGARVLPTMPIPGVGRLAYVKDTEGNVFGMLQPEPEGG